MGASKGRVAPKMRQAALNLPSEPAPDYRGELLSVGITSAVLGALGGSVAAAMLLTPKGSAEAFRNGQQEAAQNFELEKAELESKYQDEVEKLKKKAGVAPAPPTIDPEMQKENDFLKGELASKEAIVKKSAEDLQKITEERDTLKQSYEQSSKDLKQVTEQFTQLQQSQQAKSDPNLQKQLEEKAKELSDVSAQAEQRRQALQDKENQYTQLEQQHVAIVQELEGYKSTVPGLEETIRTHEGTIGERDNTIAGLEKRITELEEHISDLDSQLGNAKSTNTTLSSEAKDVDGQRAEAASALARVRAELDQAKGREQELTRQLNELETKKQEAIDTAVKNAVEETSVQLDDTIKKLEEQLGSAIQSSSKVVTQHYAKAARENLGGIQLRETLGKGWFTLGDVSEKDFADYISTATKGLFDPLKEQVLVSGTKEGKSLLGEWEEKSNEIMDQLRSGAIDKEQFWKQKSLAHSQHIRRRTKFLNEVDAIIGDLQTGYVYESRKIASDFYTEYLNSDPGKRYKVVQVYGKKFRDQYQEMKKKVFAIQTDIQKDPTLNLGGFFDPEGEPDVKLNETALSTYFSNAEAYTASLLGKKKRGKR